MPVGVDPSADDERRFDPAGYQCLLLAESFLTEGFDCVIIGGNGVHNTWGDQRPVALLLGLGDVCHVTDPSLLEIRRGVASRRRDRALSGSKTNVSWMRARYREWTCRIDNSAHGPEATFAHIADRTGHGEAASQAR
jgi:hypothetical protein